MVTSMDENVDRLFQMLDHEAPDVRAQGHEILDCLDASARWQLALRLISPDRRAWRKAANYLLPHAIAAPRLTRFAVRCAEYRLQLRPGFHPSRRQMLLSGSTN